MPSQLVDRPSECIEKMRVFFMVAVVTFTGVVTESTEAKTCSDFVKETQTRAATERLKNEKIASDSIFRKLTLTIDELSVKQDLPSTPKPARDLARVRRGEVKSLILEYVKAEGLTEAPSVERLHEITERISKWARQSYQLKGAEAHSLADRPRIDVLSELQSWKLGLEPIEREHFDLAAPRLSRYLWLRAHFASKGEPSLERLLLTKLLEEARPNFLASVQEVADRSKERSKTGEKQTDDDTKIVQLMTGVKSNSKLLDQERDRMLERDENGRTLIENVRNIVLSTRRDQFEGGRSLQRFAQFDPFTASLGRDPETRRAEIDSFIYESIVDSMIYYPYDIEAPRAQNAYKSHFADRVFTDTSRTILRASKHHRDLVENEGRSLNAKTRLKNDDGAERGSLIAASQTSHVNDLSDREILNRINFQTLVSNPLYLPLEQLRSTWVVSQFVDSEKPEGHNLTHVGIYFKAWKEAAAEGMRSLSNIAKEELLDGRLSHDREVNYLASLLAAHTPKIGFASELIETAKSFLNFLNPEELRALRIFLLEPKNFKLETYPAQISEILEVWNHEAGLGPLTNVMPGRSYDRLLPTPRALEIKGSELRQTRKFFEDFGGVSPDIFKLINDYQKHQIVDAEARAWLSVVTQENASKLYAALSSAKKMELDASLDRFFAGLAKTAQDRKEEFKAPRPWWK